jgi:hypothetical protein
MDRVSIIFTRAGLLWLVAGVILGALMLSDNIVPGDWKLWFAPTHGHMLFVGWFLQFAIGIGYWLLPRKRTPEKPLGYDERLGMLAIVLLNAGLLLRVIAEPAGRMGYTGWLDDYTLAASSLIQLAAILIIARQIWIRLTGRPPRRTEPGASRPEATLPPS